MSVLMPPLVVFLLPLALTIAIVMTFILLILRRGWSGYRGLIGATVFLVLAFGLFRLMLTGALTTTWLFSGTRTNIEAILWGGIVLSLVAIFVLAVMIQRTARPIRNREA